MHEPVHVKHSTGICSRADLSNFRANGVQFEGVLSCKHDVRHDNSTSTAYRACTAYSAQKPTRSNYLFLDRGVCSHVAEGPCSPGLVRRAPTNQQVHQRSHQTLPLTSPAQYIGHGDNDTYPCHAESSCRLPRSWWAASLSSPCKHSESIWPCNDLQRVS